MVISISPKDWGLKQSTKVPAEVLNDLKLNRDEIENRCYRNSYEWLPKQFNNKIGAFYGFYNPQTGEFHEPQTVNIIAPWQLLATYDRYQDEKFLKMAEHCVEWLHNNFVDSHPMSLVLGGVRDNFKPEQLWTKYTADYVITNLGIYQRTKEKKYLKRAIQSGKFLLQSHNHGFAPIYDREREVWIEKGWQSFGRVIGAWLGLYKFTKDEFYLNLAIQWGEYGMRLQSGNGCFYLIHDDYYSSDIAADEIRGLIQLHQQTGRKDFLNSAIAFVEWHLRNQTKRGCWPLAIDRSGIKVSDYIGPGDAPNIGIALLMAHKVTQKIELLESTVKVVRFSLSVQQTPENRQHYPEDPNLLWGFWSWDPPYDFTMSCDQSTHHIRGFWFFLDYFLSLDEKIQKNLVYNLKGRI